MSLVPWETVPPQFTYVGASIPLAGKFIGQFIQVDNAAVPSGRSMLRWNGSIWAPPRGEPIALRWRSLASPLALVTPGVTTLVEIYGSAGPVIPDYMLPDGLVFEASGWLFALNPAGAAGCVVGLGLSGSIPTGAADFQYPHAATVTPAASGLGISYSTRGRGIVSGANFRGGSGTGNGGGIISNVHGAYVAGANRAWAMAKPSKTDDQIRLDGYSFVSEGNL